MTTIEKQLSAAPNSRRYLLTVTAIVILLFVWSSTAISWRDIDQSGMRIAWSILKGLIHPDTGLLFNLSQQSVGYLLVQTVAIAFLGTLVGSLAVPFAFLASSNIVPKPLAWLTRLLLIVIRTVLALVYGLMFIRVSEPGPFAGVMPIALTSIGMLAKLYTDAIEELDTRVLESMREASILGLVGAGGIGAPLIFAMRSYKWDQVGSILIGMVVLILIIELVSNKLRKKLIHG